MIIKNKRGFTLVELMITMVIFLLVIAAVSNIFIGLLNQYKQQSKIAETNIEGIIGLEMFRQDVEQAGYGLPWTVDLNGTRTGKDSWTALPCFCEAASVAATATSPNPSTFNDGATIGACTTGSMGQRTPRAMVASNNTGPNASDYLVVKATNVATNTTAAKWTYIRDNSGTPVYMTPWGNAQEDLSAGDRVITTLPARGDNQRILLTNSAAASCGTQYVAPFNLTATSHPASFSPTEPSDMFLIYGIKPPDNPVVEPRMPFNRADYYISTTAATVPSRCAAGTGVLLKSVLNHADGLRGAGMPLLDCVADMQVTLRLDMNDDGIACTISNADGSTVVPRPGAACAGLAAESASIADVQATLVDATQLRNRLKEIRVFILAHEGQMDSSINFTNFTAGACATCITVGNRPNGEDLAAVTKDFDLTAFTNFVNYRWKVYTMALKPYNLR